MWWVFVGVIVFSVPPVCAGQLGDKPKAKSIEIDRLATADARVLGGPPETVTMRSGSVVLLPSKSIGTHNTGDYEEAVVVLAGNGEMRLADGTVLKLKPYVVAYCPPGTEHDVMNMGNEPLRYVYVVAKVK
jgi:mannose-6-phosphate isomerase-like protein (cupin superfamily)